MHWELIPKIMISGLLKMTGELKGDYFPLHGSRSYAAKPNGMSIEKEEALRQAGNLFQEPDSTLLLSSGCGRHWPDARGIFHNEAMNLFVWVNEKLESGQPLFSWLSGTSRSRQNRSAEERYRQTSSEPETEVIH